MRSRMRDDITPASRWALRMATTLVATATVFAGISTPAFAADLAAPSTSTFGLLGPVGIVAVGLGVVGMIAGVARRRRDALTRSVAARSAAAEQTTAERAARVAESREQQPIPAPSRPPAVEQRTERTLPLPAVQSTRAA